MWVVAYLLRHHIIGAFGNCANNTLFNLAHSVASAVRAIYMCGWWHLRQPTPPFSTWRIRWHLRRANGWHLRQLLTFLVGAHSVASVPMGGICANTPFLVGAFGGICGARHTCVGGGICANTPFLVGAFGICGARHMYVGGWHLRQQLFNLARARGQRALKRTKLGGERKGKKSVCNLNYTTRVI
jgi:hypothetical protein